MSDIRIRELERHAMADPSDLSIWERWRTEIMRARPKKPLRDLEKTLDHLAKRIQRVSRTPYLSDDNNPRTAAGQLIRRWRKLYREWLRRSGNREKREKWITPPLPCHCNPSPDAIGFFQHNTECGNGKRSIVLIRDDLEWKRSEALKSREWSENMRYINQARWINRRSHHETQGDQ